MARSFHPRNESITQGNGPNNYYACLSRRAEDRASQNIRGGRRAFHMSTCLAVVSTFLISQIHQPRSISHTSRPPYPFDQASMKIYWLILRLVEKCPASSFIPIRHTAAPVTAPLAGTFVTLTTLVRIWCFAFGKKHVETSIPSHAEELFVAFSMEERQGSTRSFIVQ